MLHKHFDNKILSGEAEMVPNRNGFGEGLLEAGKQDGNVVALSADLTESTRAHLFKEAFPERFVQVGVAEQNMASVASGMSAMGKVPFISSYAMFSPGRSWEQVRTTIAYNDANVKIVGAHAGISVGPDGATHQAIEDIALMRVMPNMIVIAPADVHEARKAVLKAAEHTGPVYLRMAREKTAVITTPDSPFEIGRAYTVYEAEGTERKVGLIVTGTLLGTAITAAESLKSDGINVTVLHTPTIKPLDTKAVLALTDSCEKIVTLEEHQIAGGLGGAVCELLSGQTSSKQVLRIGVADEFGQSGTPDELLKHYGLDASSVESKIKELF